MSLAHKRLENFSARFGIFYTLIALTFKSKYFPTSSVKQRIFGFKVYADSPHTLLCLLIEIFIEETYYFSSNIENPKIIDCGANLGLSVLYFKFLYPKSCIIAIEPNAIAFSYLEKNIKQNDLDQVILMNVCISDKIGKKKLYYSKGSSIANASLFQESGKSFFHEVEAVLLSDLLSKNKVDLVKMDIEGSERQVLMELKKSGMLGKPNLYLIEYHKANKYLNDVIQEVLTNFANAGFTFNTIKSDGDLMLRFQKKDYTYTL
jgi:FkbM family methyltransferase